MIISYYGGVNIREQGIGDQFQQQTKYSQTTMGEGPDWSIQPELYKHYKQYPHIQLPKPQTDSLKTFNDVLTKRKSIRSFQQKPMSQSDLSFLLWASTGIQRKEHGYEFRTAPSAGALYPIETYLVINNVESIKQGVYHYNIKHHYLEQLHTGDFRKDITIAALHQQMCATASVVFIWTALFNRSKCKYGQRAYRYIYLDAGHIAENLALAATNRDLGSCHIAALFDEDVNTIIDVDGTTESTIYLTVVGHPKPEEYQHE
ncbi:MAG: SagB/ThcOx family dehydrogenase [Candidatus Thermoplasmatota archaeon]|nr:SagB/ThcOx family dehydrogenase [Candidatus Thermoplasmatota archaeon]